jgi:acetyl esterase/lipase
MYVSRNFGKVVGLECPEPLANLYSRSYFRATWITTALDAGFWTAMKIRNKFLRDFLSMVFSVYYLICAEQADEKVRKIRGMLTVDHLRVSWNKPTTPYLGFLTSLIRPRLMRYPPRAIRIPRPKSSVYTEPIHAWLYFDGPIEELKLHDKVVLDVPGGGFIAMTPRTHDDKLLAWAGKSGLPVLSLDYRKAPEHPYPYALNECYDVYHTLITSHGRCIGMSGEYIPKIVLSGDSAGGNLAVSTLLMILQSDSPDTGRWQGEAVLPVPVALVLIYPALDINIGNWMTDEQMALIKDRQARKANRGVLSRKSQDYKQLTPSTPHHSDDEAEDDDPKPATSNDSNVTVVRLGASTDIYPSAAHISPTISNKVAPKPQTLKTRLAMSSMISYFNDRILSPEMMRAMIILYIGPHNRPDFATDFLLSPLLAPESLLARFPKTYFLTGERDPLVDDTVIFAGRLRQAQKAHFLERKELGLIPSSASFREEDVVEVCLLPGISHGFLQFAGIFPDGWKYIFRCAEWICESFDRADAPEIDDDDEEDVEPAALRRSRSWFQRQRSQTWDGRRRRHHRARTDSSGDEDRPLEMTRIGNSPSGANSKKQSSSTKQQQQQQHDMSSTSGAAAGGDPANGQIKPSGGIGARTIGRASSAAARGKRKGAEGRKRSLVSLASEDDLLGRRMKELAGGLMGLDESQVPPTP